MLRIISSLLVLSLPALSGALPRLQPRAASVKTTSGVLTGSDDGTVASFKGVPFAQPPLGSLRWTPPVAFTSNNTITATTLGPSCLQQITPSAKAAVNPLYNTPPPARESEDCLYLNVWAPSGLTGNLPVLFWIHGGAYQFGSASLPLYDGTSIAKNQKVILVSINYRTHIFGFPLTSNTAEVPISGGEHNLGLLDQESALQWVRQNIAAFGGDPNRIFLMGQSAGASSITYFLQRHVTNPPFAGAIMLSSAYIGEETPNTDEASWTAFASGVGCNQPAGAQRISCLRGVSASTIMSYMNSSKAPTAFKVLIDNVTVFSNPVVRILNGQSANVPIFEGGMKDDGSLYVIGQTNVQAYLDSVFGPGVVSASQVNSLYPAQTVQQELSNVVRDVAFLCPASMLGNAYVKQGQTNIYRYLYGAAFADLQKLSGVNLGAYHASELYNLFGNYPSTATTAEKQLSVTFQTIVANFAKDPTSPPAPNWPKYNPSTTSFVELAFNNNTAMNNVVQTVTPQTFDKPCTLWNKILSPAGSA